MNSEDIRDKEVERLKRSIKASAIVHLVVIVILSIPIIRRQEETFPKLLEVCRITESEAKEIRKTLEGSKTNQDAGDKGEAEKKAVDTGDKGETEKKAVDTGDRGQAEKKVVDIGNRGEAEKKAVDMGNEGETEKKAVDTGDKGKQEGEIYDSAKSYVPPSVGPQVGEEEKKGIIEAEGEVADDVSEVSAQHDKTGDTQPKAFLDKLRNSFIRYREKKRQEKKKKTNDIVRDSAEKSKSLPGQEKNARISMQNDVSHDKARFLCYAKTYSTFGKEKKWNMIIDFSFSSNSIMQSFFEKYDIKRLPLTQVRNLRHSTKGGQWVFITRNRQNPELDQLQKYYESKYGETAGFCVVGGYLYLWQNSGPIRPILNKLFYEKISEKYSVGDRKEVDDFIASHKTVVVYEIDEEKLEFRVRELSFYEID